MRFLHVVSLMMFRWTLRKLRCSRHDDTACRGFQLTDDEDGTLAFPCMLQQGHAGAHRWKPFEDMTGLEFMRTVPLRRQLDESMLRLTRDVMSRTHDTEQAS